MAGRRIEKIIMFGMMSIIIALLMGLVILGQRSEAIESQREVLRVEAFSQMSSFEIGQCLQKRSGIGLAMRTSRRQFFSRSDDLFNRVKHYRARLKARNGGTQIWFYSREDYPLLINDRVILSRCLAVRV